MSSGTVSSFDLARQARVGARRELRSFTRTGRRSARRTKHNSHVVPGSNHDMRRTSTSRRQITGSPEPLPVIQSP